MAQSERALTLPSRDDDDADPAIAAILSKVRSKLGFLPNMYRNMANAPGLLDTYLVGYDAFRSDSGLTPAEQETVLQSPVPHRSRQRFRRPSLGGVIMAAPSTASEYRFEHPSMGIVLRDMRIPRSDPGPGDAIPHFRVTTTDGVVIDNASLRRDGRLVYVAFLEGSKGEADLLPIMVKRLTITGSTMRPRSLAEKTSIRDALATHIWPALSRGELLPHLYARFPLAQAAEAHRLMESSRHIGKIVLEVGQA